MYPSAKFFVKASGTLQGCEFLKGPSDAGRIFFEVAQGVDGGFLFAPIVEGQIAGSSRCQSFPQSEKNLTKEELPLLRRHAPGSDFMVFQVFFRQIEPFQLQLVMAVIIISVRHGRIGDDQIHGLFMKAIRRISELVYVFRGKNGSFGLFCTSRMKSGDSYYLFAMDSII